METDSNCDRREGPVRERVRARRVEPDACHIERHARELMAMAAHDLRSPLVAIRWIAAAITGTWRAGDTPSPAEWAAAVAKMCRAAEDALKLVDDLLAAERFDDRVSRRPPPEHVPLYASQR